MSLVTARGTDPDSCDEFGYGLGTPGGILVLRYVAAAALEFGGTRQDWLNQLYWSPDGLMSVSYGGSTEFVGAGEAVWVQRAVTHLVQTRAASARHTVYRLCLREDPAGLAGMRIGPTTLDEWAARLHVSPKTLQRDFQRQFGQSFTAWRASLRLRASLILLDAYPVSDVAHRVGYSSASAYIAAFRRRFGRTPGQAERGFSANLEVWPSDSEQSS